MIPGSLVSRIFNDMIPSRGKTLGGMEVDSIDEGMLTRFKDPELVIGEEGISRRTGMMPEMERTTEEKKQMLAMQMYYKGATPDEQIARTGYYYGPDGVARQEINDDAAFLKVPLSQIKKDDSYRLGDLMEHPEFFSIYPELQDINVKAYSSKGTENGYFDLKSGEIGLNLNSKQVIDGDPVETFTTLLHETQHAIQKLEKMDTGGQPEMFVPDVKTAPKALKEMAERMYLSLYGEAEARNVQARYGKGKGKKNFIETLLKDPQSLQAQLSRFRLIRNKYKEPAINADQPTQFEDINANPFDIDPTLRGM